MAAWVVEMDDVSQPEVGSWDKIHSQTVETVRGLVVLFKH